VDRFVADKISKIWVFLKGLGIKVFLGADKSNDMGSFILRFGGASNPCVDICVCNFRGSLES
jgi:hypothetical protein